MAKATYAAHSTYQSYLMYYSDTSSKWEKLHDVSSIPDLSQEPETIETTTLTDDQQTFVKGIKGNDNMTFESYYNLDAYKKLDALDDDKVHHFAVYFGADSSDVPDGNRGIFEFDGYLTVIISGAGVNEALGMNIVITPTTPIELVSTPTTSWS